MAEPISLRINDDVIITLKKEARRLSYENDRDISYVDLIREAVETYIKTLLADVVDPVRLEMSNSGNRLATTEYVGRQIETALRENEAKLNGVGESTVSAIKNTLRIPTDSYQLPPDPDELSKDEVQEFLGVDMKKPLAKRVSNSVMKRINKLSLARRVLKPDTDYSEGMFRYKRDPAAVVWCIGRRGAVPESIVEGEEAIIPTFDIACHPSVKYSDLLRGRQHSFRSSLDSASDAIVKEENTNLFKLLICAAQGRKDQVVTYTNDVQMEHLELAYGQIARHHRLPAFLICNSVTHLRLSNLGASTTGDWNFYRKDDPNSIVGGRYRTAEVLISDRMDDGKIIMTASAEHLGRIPIEVDGRVVTRDCPEKLRAGYVAWETIGMVVLEDWCIAVIEKAEPASSLVTLSNGVTYNTTTNEIAMGGKTLVAKQSKIKVREEPPSKSARKKKKK